MKQHIALAAALILAAATAQAITIEVDLGPRDNAIATELIVPFDAQSLAFNGETITIDFTFGNKFIHLYHETSPTFDIQPWLVVSGRGRMDDPVGIAYTVGANGLRNGAIWSFGGGGVISGGGVFNFGLGYVFPLYYGEKPSNIYGLHMEITMPLSYDFTIVGGGFPCFTNAYYPWEDRFAVRGGGGQ